MRPNKSSAKETGKGPAQRMRNIRRKSQNTWKKKRFLWGWKEQTNIQFYTELLSRSEEQKKLQLGKTGKELQTFQEMSFLTELQIIRSSFEQQLYIRKQEQEKQTEQSKETGGEGHDFSKHPFSRTPSNGQSKLQNDFEIINNLGKGAYGCVVKVRNKLDNKCYAVKLIKLNANSEKLKKMRREAEILADLKHENVVRYFGSWLENDTVDFATTFGFDDPSSSCSYISEDQVLVSKKDNILKSESLSSEEENSNSDEGEAGGGEEEDEYEEEGEEGEYGEEHEDENEEQEDEEQEEGYFLSESSSSPDVVFEDSYADDLCKNIGGDAVKSDVDSKKFQWMCIQMEFCHSTLRNAIDNGLYRNEERVWRLFRELVEGLVYIHEQNFIHRDLKPMNIFLDSCDHVKIGDFGVAKSIISPRFPFSTLFKLTTTTTEKETRIAENVTEDSTLTSYLGTALYDAPELGTIHDQKVDVYSLGIIFFEMCYPPLSTNMQRIEILTKLRDREIILPSEFTMENKPRQFHVIKWMLKHNLLQRPSSSDLLNSGFVPPSKHEDPKVQKMIRETMSNPKSAAYKYVMHSCFEQDTSEAGDIVYDINFFENMPSPLLQSEVKKRTENVFKKHGAIDLPTPLLMPHNTLYDDKESCVQLMTKTGGIVTLPHDLCVPFARCVGWNGITDLKRYSIDKVYKEKGVLCEHEILYGFHPKEFWEGTFDIVSSNSGYLMEEAELLSIVWNIVNEFHSLKSKQLTIRLNHSSLWKAIFMFAGIEETHYLRFSRFFEDLLKKRLAAPEIKRVFAAFYPSFTTAQNTQQLLRQSIAIELLLHEDQLSNIFKIFQVIAQTDTEAASLANKGLNELKIIISLARNLGVKCPIVISPFLLHNVEWYSGMMCQFVYKVRNKRGKTWLHIIGSGGRYDDMIANFRKKAESVGCLTSEKKIPAAAGITLSLSKIASLLQDNEDVPPVLDVAVCFIGRTKCKEKALVMKKLWSANIRSSLINNLQSVEEVQKYCERNSIQLAVVHKENQRGGKVTILRRDGEENRFQEREVNTADMMYVLLKFLDNKKVRTESNMLPNPEEQDTNSASFPIEEYPVWDFIYFPMPGYASTVSTEKRLKIKVDISKYVSPKARTMVISVTLSSDVIATIVRIAEFRSDQRQFNRSVALIAERHPENPSVASICYDIYKIIQQKRVDVIVLYGLLDDNFKFL